VSAHATWLRESSKLEGKDVDLQALLDGDVDSGVAHGEVLVALSEALVEGDPESIAIARRAVARDMGTEAMVDAIGVASNFERMVRIADSTGIELGEFLDHASADVRSELGMARPEGWAG